MEQPRAKQWRTQLRLFKRHLKVLAKIGVLGVWCAQEKAKTSSAVQWHHPDWDHPEWQQKFYDNILSGTCDEELARGFIRSCPFGWWSSPNPTPEDTILVADRLYNKYSRQLRVRFGALNAVSPLPEGRQVASADEPTNRVSRLSAQDMQLLRTFELLGREALASGGEDARSVAAQQL
jgi:hypothetical protein